MDKYEGHTPGPWRADEYGSSSIMATWEDGQVVQVCSVSTTSFGGMSEDAHEANQRMRAETAVNKLLIADAPTTLTERDALVKRVEALETAAKETVEFIEDNDHPRSCPASYGGDNPCRCGRNQVYDLLLVALGPEENNDERTEV